MKNELVLKQRIAELEKLLENKRQLSLQKDALITALEEIVEAIEAEQQTISTPRKKPVRKPLPTNLPREQVIHDIDDKTCDCCGGELHKMGEDKSEKLEFVFRFIAEQK